ALLLGRAGPADPGRLRGRRQVARMSPPPGRAFEPSDITRIAWLGDPQASPDGQEVAFVVTRLDEERDEYRSSIWLAAAARGRPEAGPAASLVARRPLAGLPLRAGRRPARPAVRPPERRRRAAPADRSAERRRRGRLVAGQRPAGLRLARRRRGSAGR